ncbi:copper amine oxidase N-terminal domain-containing protein [Paenibacillus sp. GYB006]|uniref:copper amine oxidase N-terminal domain-containing protein n=1 Tax=Paenibacillus sp. GYB006 TaxID=2994394 RepID=UPI002F96DA17
MEAIKIKKKLFISLFVVVFSLSIVVGLAFAKGSVKIVVNGQQVTSDVAPQIVNNRVMVPLSVVAKALDANVGWNQKNQTVTINDKAIPSQEDIWKQDLDFIGSGWASLRNIIGTFMIGFDEILKGEMRDFVITNRKIETMKKVDFFNVDEYTVFPGLSYSK